MEAPTPDPEEDDDDDESDDFGIPAIQSLEQAAEEDLTMKMADAPDHHVAVTNIEDLNRDLTGAAPPFTQTVRRCVAWRGCIRGWPGGWGWQRRSPTLFYSFLPPTPSSCRGVLQESGIDLKLLTKVLNPPSLIQEIDSPMDFNHMFTAIKSELQTEKDEKVGRLWSLLGLWSFMGSA